MKSVQQGRLEMEERRAVASAALTAATSSLWQRKAILGELIELQKEELMIRMAKRGADGVSESLPFRRRPPN